MACWYGWDDYPKDKSQIYHCKDCGADVDENGEVLSGCAYGTVLCKTCGDSPCDGSC